jgi:hypothetical protein
MSKLKIEGYGIEGIDHQYNSELGARLEGCFTEIRKSRNVTSRVLKDSGLSAIVSSCTDGMKVTFDVDMEQADNLYVFMPDLNRNHVLHDQIRTMVYEEHDAKPFLEKKGFLSGGVNLKNGTVSGDYTKVEANVYIGIGLLSQGSWCSIKELVAGVLHEIGHFFSYLEMLGRFLRTNYLLDEFVSKMLKVESKEQRTVLLSELEENTKTKIAKKADIATMARTGEAYSVLVLTQAAKASEYELGVNVYDVRAWEQLADNYAARHGYAKHLAIFLDKVYRTYGNRQYDSPTYRVFCEITKVFCWILPLYALPTMGFALGYGLLTGLILGNPCSEEYDPPDKRFMKLKQQTVDALKDKKLSRSQRVKFLEDHETIDRLINDLNSKSETVWYMWYTMFPWGKKDVKDAKHFQEVEGLLNNDLFATVALISI